MTSRIGLSLFLFHLFIIPSLSSDAAEVAGTVELYEKTLFDTRQAETLEDVFVYLLPLDETARQALSNVEIYPLKVEWINQKNKTFIPRIVAVQKGSRVRFGNADPWFHNIYGKDPDFDLGRYPRGFYREQEFTKLGVAHIFCDIHLNMHALVLVVDTPLYQRVQPDGSFRFEHVPQGKYLLNAWQERSDTESLEISVQEQNLTDLRLALREKVLKTIERPHQPRE